MNFIPLTRQEKRKLQQKIKNKQDNTHLDIPTHDNPSPIFESEGATTDREIITQFKQLKKAQKSLEPLQTLDNLAQPTSISVQPTSQEQIINNQHQIPQFNETKENVIDQPLPQSHLQQNQSDKPQILLQNQQQQMSPKKSNKLKRDLGEVSDYGKPVQGYAFIQFIQSQYSPQQNKQNDGDYLISQSYQQAPSTYDKKSSKRALNNQLKNVGSEKKSLTVIEPTEQNVLEFSRKSYRRNLSPNVATKHDQKPNLQAISSAPLKIQEEDISFNRISVVHNLQIQHLEQSIAKQNPQRLSRNLNTKQLSIIQQPENKISCVPNTKSLDAQPKKEPTSINLNEIILNQIINQDNNRKSALKRNLENPKLPMKEPISVKLNQISSSQVAAEDTHKFPLKRNLQNSTVFQPQIAPLNQPIIVHQISEEMIIREDSTKKYSRNLSKNIGSSFKPNQLQQIKTSHRINDDQLLSQNSNSSQITQGWNDRKRIFKIFRLQPSKNLSTPNINSGTNFIRKPLNSLLLK